MVPAGGYRAFISYSHKDAKWGAWLHRALEAYRVPAPLVGSEGRHGRIPPRLFPIFRDREELPTSADLGEQITVALQSSDFLVVICSPRSASSRWVNEEILAFKRLGKEARIFALIVDGEPNAGDEPSLEALETEGAANQYGTSRPYPRECFPYVLKHRLDADGVLSDQIGEPLAADARPQGDGKEAAKLKLVAGLIGVGYDTLYGREHQAQRKRARRKAVVSGSIIFALSALLILALAFAVASEHERNLALISQARHLARDSINATESGDAGMGLMLALKALPKNLEAPDRPLTTEALAALNRAWLGLREKYDFAHKHVMVFSADFSPDSKRLVTASTDDTAVIWDLATGQKSAVIATGGSYVLSAVFSPDGKMVATSSQNHAVRLWDAATGKLIKPMTGYPNLTGQLAFTPDGRYLAGVSGRGVIFWKVASGEAISAVASDAPITSAQFSPNGKDLLTTNQRGAVQAWHMPDLKPDFTVPVGASEMDEASYDRLGRRIVTLSANDEVCIWDALTRAKQRCLDNGPKVVVAANLSPDGKRLVVGSGDKNAYIYDADSGARIAVLTGHSNMLRSAAYSPDGRYIVTTAVDGTARIWLADEHEKTFTLRGHTALLHSGVFSPDGRRVATASADKTVRLWNAADGTPQAVLSGHGDAVTWAEFSPDGKRVVTASWDRTARIWDAESGATLRVLSGHTAALQSARFSPDGRRIATSAEDGSVRIWDAASGAPRKVLKTPEQIVTRLAWSHDGALLAAGAGKLGYVWRTSDGQLVQTFKGHVDSIEAIAFAPRNNAVVTASWDRSIGLWLTSMASPAFALMGHSDVVWSAKFSPDQKHILSASSDHTVRIWSIDANKELLRFGGPIAFYDASYSSDGRRVVIADGYGTATIHTLPPRCQTLLDQANRWLVRLDRRPTPEEKAQYLLDPPNDDVRDQLYEFLHPATAWLSPTEGDRCS